MKRIQINNGQKMAVAFVVATMSLIGCSEPPQFRENSVYIQTQIVQQKLPDESYPATHLDDINHLVEALFGTPDEPRFPGQLSATYADIIGATDFVEMDRLQMAAGAVASIEDGTGQGLYREHCVHCHGITGDGAGPTAAFLNPYPRDFRKGLFKFKSTPSEQKPTREDLRRTLVHGIPGTGMQSFRLLPPDELEALIDYVIYLSIRGQVERDLLAFIPQDFDFDDRIFVEDEEVAAENLEFVVDEYVARAIRSWRTALSKAPQPPARSEAFDFDHPDREKMIARGRELFMSSSKGNCFSCHGHTALGDGVTDNWDVWTKEWIDGGKVDTEDSAQVSRYVEMGALPPRHIEPRNLRLGVYRGGRTSTDLYWRIKNGIIASQMPGAAQSMTDEDIWCLVEYVKQIPYEPLSLSESAPIENERSTR